MHRDRWIALALAVLGAAVLASSRGFPAVPGQKLGAGFLPAIVGAGLVVCALLLLRRPRPAAEGGVPQDERAPLGPPTAVIAATLAYIALAGSLGFLVVTPLALLGLFVAFGVRWRASLLWALGGTLAVHVAFYKLLRVPLPWGVLRPFY